eukprot:12096103-Alexandrium_andersonii.AAC.1
MRGPGPWVRVRLKPVGTAPTPPRIAPRPVVMAVPETGTRDPSRRGSICTGRPPGRVAGLRLKLLDGLRQPRGGIGDVLGAVELHAHRAPEAGELCPPGLVEILHRLPGGRHVLLEHKDLTLGLLA